MIEQVKLVNFISHSDTTLPLQEGVTVFVGRNGSGKSSVIDGITYAMYGKHTRRANENLVRRGTRNGSASVQFTSAGRRFIVERKLNMKGQLEGSVLNEILNDSTKQLASGERKQFGESLSEEVAKAVGLDYERLKVAALIQQGELDSIIDLSPKDMKELVNSLIGIDQLGSAYDAMLEIMTSFRSIVKNKYGYDDTDLLTIGNKIAEQEQLFNSADFNLASLLQELAELRKEEEALTLELKEMEPLKAKAELLRRQIETLVDYVEREIGEMERKRKELGEVLEKGARYLDLVKGEEQLGEESKKVADEEAENERLERELSTQIATLAAQQSKPEELTKLIDKARASLALVIQEERIRQDFRDADERFQDVDSKLKAMNDERSRYLGQQDIAEQLEFKDNICPMCGSRVEKIREPFDRNAIKRHIAAHEENIAKLEQEKRKLDPELEQKQNGVRALDDAKNYLAENKLSGEDAIAKLESERSELVTRLSSLPQMKRLYERALSARDVIRTKVDGINERSREISVGKAYLLDHKIGSPDDLQQLLLKKEEVDNTMGVLPVDLEELKNATDVGALKPLAISEYAKQMLRGISELSAEASKFDEQYYNNKIEQLDGLRKNTVMPKERNAGSFRAQKEGAERELQTLRKGHEIAEQTAEFVMMLETVREKVYHRDGPVSSSLRSWALEQIAVKASEYARLFGIGISSVRLREKNRDITIECYGPRGMVEVDSLSGGEKVAIALALRFAMAYVMGGYKLDFVILDEPTVHLDEERKASMVEIISSLAKESSPLKQIIIITHDSEIFENAEVDAVWRFEASSEGTRVRLEA
jgi:DNA repair protein SbcC/Rad50